MPLKSADRGWMQRHDVFQDYVTLRDDLKTLGVPPHEAINDALYRVSKGVRGSPYTVINPESEAEPSSDSPEPPKRLNAKFGEVSDDSSYVAIQWVGQHMWVEGVTESDAPNSTAFGLLMRCHESPTFRDEFWAKMWIKTIPNQKMLESQQRFRDKGQPLIELNAEIRRVLESQQNAGSLPIDEPEPTPHELNRAALELEPDTEYDAEMSPF